MVPRSFYPCALLIWFLRIALVVFRFLHESETLKVLILPNRHFFDQSQQ